MADQIIFSTIGNYRIVSYKGPFSNVKKFRGFIIETSNEIDGVNYLHKEFRWSLNNNNWSLWLEYTDDNIKSVEGDLKELYLEFKFTLKAVENNSPTLFGSGDAMVPVTIDNFQLDITYDGVDPRNFTTAPVTMCSKEMYTDSIIFQNCDSSN